MMRWLALLTVMALAMVALAGPPQASDPEVELKAAIYTEMTDGDLEAAIEQYQQIVASNGGNRAVAAEALLRLGGCHEKLGQEEARRVYEQLINEYPEQRQAELAGKRLAVLAKVLPEAATKPNFRQIRVPITLTWGAGLSPDGKRLAMVSRDGIWLLPIQGKVDRDVAGVPRRLPLSLPEGVRVDMDPLTWSADGKWIAFNDAVSRQRRWATNMYVVSSEGGVPRKLSVAPERGELSVNYRLGLSPDGKHVAFASIENGDLHLETAPVEGGPARRLTEPPSSEPAYSPDGKLIAYVAGRAGRTAGEKAPGNVWVVPVDGGTPVLVADVNGHARSPLWSPDGRMIAFAADDAVWVVPVSHAGRPAAAPTRFDPPQFGYLTGWTADNRIGFVATRPGYAAIYTVPASGGQAAQVTPEGFWSSPKWAPDGKRVFFRNNRGHVSSVPADGGQVSEVPLRSDARIREPGAGGENAVSPDGKTIVFAGVKDGAPGLHLWTIPVEGGEPRQLTSGQGHHRFPCWSSDGKWIAFVRGERLKGDVRSHANVNIYKIPAEGGEPLQITTASDRVGFRDLAWSPDGNSVAYFSAEDNRTIKVKSLETGTSRVVGKAERSGWNSLSWSPDGKKLAFTPASNVQGPSSLIRIVSMTDGTTVTLETGLPEADYWHVSWSPDGTRLAFGAVQHREPELWFMEDFVHLVKTGS